MGADWLVESESDNSLVNLFHILSSSRSRGGFGSCDLRIPDTVSYQHGSLRYWYYYEHPDQGEHKDKEHKGEGSQSPEPGGESESVAAEVTGLSGQVARREKRECTPAHIERVFLRGHGDPRMPVACYMYKKAGFLEDVSESAPTVVEFLDQAGLKEFLYQRDSKPDGVLQRFVAPKGHNSVTQVVWTPYLCQATRRLNVHKLTDTRTPLYDRCVTHEGRSHLSHDVICAPRVVEQLAVQCRAIAGHYYSVEHRLVTRLVLYFKFDKARRPVLLYPSSIVMSTFHSGGVSKSPSAAGALGAAAPPTKLPRDARGLQFAAATLLAGRQDKRIMVNLNPTYQNTFSTTRDQPGGEAAKMFFAMDTGFGSPPRPPPAGEGGVLLDHSVALCQRTARDALSPQINPTPLSSIRRRHQRRRLLPPQRQVAGTRWRWAPPGSSGEAEGDDGVRRRPLRWTGGGGAGVYEAPSPSTTRPHSVGRHPPSPLSPDHGAPDAAPAGAQGAGRQSLAPSDSGSECEEQLRLGSESGGSEEDADFPAELLIAWDSSLVEPAPQAATRSPQYGTPKVCAAVTGTRFAKRLNRVGRRPSSSSPAGSPTAAEVRPPKQLRNAQSRGFWRAWARGVRRRACEIVGAHRRCVLWLDEAGYRLYSRIRLAATTAANPREQGFSLAAMPGGELKYHVVRAPGSIMRLLGEPLRALLASFGYNPLEPGDTSFAPGQLPMDPDECDSEEAGCVFVRDLASLAGDSSDDAGPASASPHALRAAFRRMAAAVELSRVWHLEQLFNGMRGAVVDARATLRLSGGASATRPPPSPQVRASTQPRRSRVQGASPTRDASPGVQARQWMRGKFSNSRILTLLQQLEAQLRQLQSERAQWQGQTDSGSAVWPPELCFALDHEELVSPPVSPSATSAPNLSLPGRNFLQ
eukprot:TRINITY_DN55102_c0_g1_i1.p1 TRINITY_DN55102_c0_g1~~TRINITY_DN55102_c0_g1_i1.p1  ORF type:complete len:947 (+),score=226.22 TRINITY_DN55102_c0_g1_i1:82-2841(+)